MSGCVKFSLLTVLFLLPIGEASYSTVLWIAHTLCRYLRYSAPWNLPGWAKRFKDTSCARTSRQLAYKSRYAVLISVSAGKDLDAPGTEEIRPAVGGPRDRSRKGSVDKEILPLLNQLNALENFYTSSSCSGRVLLLGIPKEDCNAVTSCCSIPLNTAQSPVTRSLPSPDESGLSNVLAFGSSLNSAASASSSAGHPASSSPAASPSCAVSSRPRSSTARDEAFTRDYLKDGSDKREGRRRQKHSKVFILNHHEEVTAQLLLQAIRACPLRCEEIWCVFLQRQMACRPCTSICI